VFLKVKIKSLACESQIIRLEERRAKRLGDTDRLQELHSHRVLDVRRAARHALLAYAFLRGRSRLSMERHPIRRDELAAILDGVTKNVRRFGGDPATVEAWLRIEETVAAIA